MISCAPPARPNPGTGGPSLVDDDFHRMVYACTGLSDDSSQQIEAGRLSRNYP